ncbi:MAG: hypothetical protein J6Z82_00625 [Schwartzia sp.]|nr:hypothetical protein [Schwartzia sp. (in: firmicutes)]
MTTRFDALRERKLAEADRQKYWFSNGKAGALPVLGLQNLVYPSARQS